MTMTKTITMTDTMTMTMTDTAVNQNIFGENRICISFLGCRAFVERHRCQGSNDNEQELSGKPFTEQLNTQRVNTKNSGRHNKLKII